MPLMDGWTDGGEGREEKFIFGPRAGKDMGPKLK